MYDPRKDPKTAAVDGALGTYGASDAVNSDEFGKAVGTKPNKKSGAAPNGVINANLPTTDLLPKHKKPTVVAAPDQMPPGWVNTPQFDPNFYNFNAPSAATAPTPFSAAQIRPVSDPRQVLIDPTQQAQFRQGQQDLVSRLTQQANGQGPSVAGAQLQQAQQANQAAAFAQLNSARGQGNPGLARQTMMTSSNLQAQTARDSAVARMQEQLNAQQALGSTLGGARQQDIGLATQQAQLTQEANLASYKGQLETAIQQGQLDQSTAETLYKAAQDRSTQQAGAQNALQQQYNDIKFKYIQAGMSAEQANQAAVLAVNGANQNAAFQNYQAQVAAAAAKRQQEAQYWNAGGTVAGAAATYYGGPAAGAAAKEGTTKVGESQTAKNNPAPVYDNNGSQVPDYSTTGGGSTSGMK